MAKYISPNQNIMKKLDGKKTYLVVLAMIVVVAYTYVQTGVLDNEMLLEALAIAGLRHGIAK